MVSRCSTYRIHYRLLPADASILGISLGRDASRICSKLRLHLRLRTYQPPQQVVSRQRNCRIMHHIIYYSFLEGPKAALVASRDFQFGHYTTTPQAGIRAFGRVYSAWAYGQTVGSHHSLLTEYLARYFFIIPVVPPTWIPQRRQVQRPPGLLARRMGERISHPMGCERYVNPLGNLVLGRLFYSEPCV